MNGELLVFQSTPSVGRATKWLMQTDVFAAISIHALRGEGDTVAIVGFFVWLLISIHALRGEGDTDVKCKVIAGGEISIHALRGEGDAWSGYIRNKKKKFQSTPSVGRATPTTECIACRDIFQSTPSVGRATRPAAQTYAFWRISIHALRGEGDARDGFRDNRAVHFNPRPPWGGRLHTAIGIAAITWISIHALRGEGDERNPQRDGCTRDFNPRPPWGGRHQACGQ